MARKSTGKRLRFRVFERDNFTCQYCGKRPPEVILVVDHFVAVSKGGENEIDNLVTACFDCNAGKSNFEIGKLPHGVQKNLDDIRERYEQLKEFYKFQKKIKFIKEEALEDVCLFWSSLWNERYYLNVRGKVSIKMFLQIFTPDEIKDAMEMAVVRVSDVRGSFKYMCAILHTQKRKGS